MNNLGVIITDGVGFRNFVLSDFIQEAEKAFDKVVIFSCLPAFVYQDVPSNCIIVELDVIEEKFVNWFFRKAKEATHLQLFAKNNFGIQDNLNNTRSKENNPRGIATRLIHRFSKFFHSEKLVLLYDKLQQNTFRNNPITKQYEQLLSDYDISLVFFTHQRPSFIAPMIYAAKKLNIKTATFIFSWDNLASKGRMAGNFDNYLVWSDLMKEELLYFYQSITNKQVAIVGTPQFEPYVLPKYGYEKEDFIKKFHLDARRPTILFTCNDSSSKNDPIYLELLAEFIASEKLMKEVNLIVRTSPVEDPKRFEHINDKYPFIVWNFPDWKVKRPNHQEVWTQRVPSKADVDDLKSLLKYCDLNINVLSTITLDSFIFDKPVINPVFGNVANGMFDDQKFFNYQHLSKLVAMNASHIVRNEKEFLDAINTILANGDDKANLRKKFLDLQIGKPLEKTSQRIAEVLLTIDNG